MASPRYAGWPMATKTYVSGIGQVRKSRWEVWSSDRRVFLLGLKLLGLRLLGLKTIVLRLLTLCMFMGLTAGSFLTATAVSKSPQTTSPQESGTATPEPQEHGLSAKPVEIARPFNFPITNSMLVSWMVAIGLIVFAQLATRKMKQVPSGAQNFLEWLVDALYKFLVGIIGAHLAERTFWFFATIFIFVLFSNWFGLIPGIGSLGWGHQTDHGFRIDQPLFRGANADVNMTLAMALVFFAAWIVWALREVGIRGFLRELFAPKGESEGVLRLLLVVVFFAAGCLEVVSILFRPISLSFRLYGNIFAGENLLEAMSKLVPGFGWLVAIPFYFLELVMGLVQAMVFMLLTAVFTMLMCQHETEAPLAAHG
ncbi:MAG TPA: F0F1 ATP synthase subunit A [Candidatus Acidoferrum sp.]|jgi:F-type H+-transporting ATPase subunit a|nr:F0F1 ATP synthase subunit A [Candidatus Acidoferrum sp.]